MKWIRVLSLGGLFAFSVGYFTNGWAREWYFQPNASVQSFYNNNIRMISDQNQARANVNRDAFGFLTYGNADFGVRADDYDIGVSATGVIKRYISDLDLNNDNVYITAKSLFKLTERQTFGLNGRFADDTLLGSVIETTDASQQNTTRTTLAINPEWTYALAEFTSIHANYEHMDVSYGSTGALEQRFYDNTRDFGTVELLHQWHPLLKSHVTFGATLFDVPTPNQTTTNYSAMAGIDYRISETWTATLGGGFRVTDIEMPNAFGATVNDNSTGPLFEFKTQKEFETANIRAGYYRETAFRGSGGFSLVDVSYLGYTQKLGDRFVVAFNSSYNDVRSLIAVNPQNFTFYSIGASASWFITPQFNLTARHQYRFKESQVDSANNADSNAFFITLDYKWDPFSTRKF
jgi:hypothetical protein